jgi:hypothetical protein
MILKLKATKEFELSKVYNPTNVAWPVQELNIEDGTFMPPANFDPLGAALWEGYETRKLIGVTWKLRDMQRSFQLTNTSAATTTPLVAPASTTTTTTRIGKWRLFYRPKTFGYENAPSINNEESFHTKWIKTGGAGPMGTQPHMDKVNIANVHPMTQTYNSQAVKSLAQELLDFGYPLARRPATDPPTIVDLYSANMWLLPDDLYPQTFWQYPVGDSVAHTGRDTISGYLDIVSTWSLVKKRAV